MFRQAQPRQMRSFRLDNMCSERLKTLSGQLGASQGELIEQLVNACYDSACVDFNVDGFKGFTDRCKEIKEEMQVRTEFKELVRSIQEDSIKNCTDKMTMDEIDTIIAKSRQERQAKQT